MDCNDDEKDYLFIEFFENISVASVRSIPTTDFNDDEFWIFDVVKIIFYLSWNQTRNNFVYDFDSAMITFITNYKTKIQNYCCQSSSWLPDMKTFKPEIA